MPGSRGNDPDGVARADRVAEWQARAFPSLRRDPPAVSIDDALPVDPLADVEATRRALDAARAAE